MKLAFMILPIFLGACSVGHAQWEPQTVKAQYEVDTTPRNVLNLIHQKGINDAILTGLRTELCQDDHDIIGYGVILKEVDKSGKSNAVGATVCLNWDNEIAIFPDK